MCFLTNKIIILVIFCIGVLSIQPESVLGSRNIDLALRWGREGRLLLQNADSLHEMNVPPHIAPPPTRNFDPNQSEKRPVKGGSDPIHNRS
ncbi:hypothetical protein CDL12_12216 [Handroanthus impetiginosus]|uniref:CLAVATA3/ESR (CLE)-related protein n=1 Tax=Handroanthus impetiginosus TaxID=429701 RepID=A0A2G9HCB2_9LAMI|nr:hypothetical protein CDL12_12216 [Handroanthus impetiginosus]